MNNLSKLLAVAGLSSTLNLGASAIANEASTSLLKASTCYGMLSAWSIEHPTKGNSEYSDARKALQEDISTWNQYQGTLRASITTKGSQRLAEFNDAKIAETTARKISIDRLRAGDQAGFLNDFNTNCALIVPEVGQLSADVDRNVYASVDDFAKATKCSTMLLTINNYIFRSSHADKDSLFKWSSNNMTVWGRHARTLEREQEPGTGKEIQTNARREGVQAVRPLLKMDDVSGSLRLLEDECYAAMPEIEPYLIN